MFQRCSRTFAMRTKFPFHREFSDVVVSFKNTNFEYVHGKPILSDANFSIRNGSKVTIMGQNGSGKSTIIKLIAGGLQPDSGMVNTGVGLCVSTSKQCMEKTDLELTIRDYFLGHAQDNESGLDSRIAAVLNKVGLQAPLGRQVKTFSGGQQARLLLAAALIEDSDVLLLDEPTNNLDQQGIDLLTEFIITCPKTCVVISHDEDFLNSFSDSVLYLDQYSKQVEQYEGDYHSVKSDIAKRIAKEKSDNVRLQKAAQAKKEQSSSFANKGGGMRKVAKKMREVAEQMESEIVDIRREDRSLRKFNIPLQDDLTGVVMTLSGVVLPDNRMISDTSIIPLRHGPITMRRDFHLQLVGPNGIGKTTLLRELAFGNTSTEVCEINPEVRIGYYSQDFSTLDYNQTVIESLREAATSCGHGEQHIRQVAGSFLLSGDIVKQKIITLSEGQKGLLSFARLVLLEPGMIIFDEPTNHINFRHLPAVAAALNSFKGVLILVSHDHDFVSKVRVDQQICLVNDVKVV